MNTGQNFVMRTFRDSSTCDLTDSQSHQEDTSIVELTRITSDILHALEYREREERHAMIASPFDGTYEWVFNNSNNNRQQWDNLEEWSESGTGCYWINGKAGSGKSTLMKYINSHKSTRATLKQWAGSDQLIVGSFFFYYNGTTLQKSQTGLLRSLLLSVLSHKRELVPVLFPGIINALLSEQQRSPVKLTSMELKMAFTMLMDTKLVGSKVCFLIDGLDEYTGEYEDLAKLFASATRSDRVKLLLSSRPIPVCVYAFSNGPKLRLQDLTYKDIQCFANSELGQHPLMQRLERVSPGATAELVDSIVSKSSSVFLWVDVVVKMLIRCLINYDTLADLRQRMNELSFAEEQDYERCLSDSPSILSKDEEAWRLESTEGRLRSRCCGLLEVQDPSNPSHGKAGSTITYLHRTVVEFLENPNNWHEITSWTKGTYFNTSMALISSSLSEMKATLLSPGDRNDGTLAFRAVARILTFESTLEQEGRSLCREVFVPNLISTLFSTWGEKECGRCNRLDLELIEKLTTTAALHCEKNPLTILLGVCSGWAIDGIAKGASQTQIAAYLLSDYVDEPSVSTRARLAHGIMKCCIDPDETIYFKGASRRFWDDRFKVDVYQDQQTS